MKQAHSTINVALRIRPGRLPVVIVIGRLTRNEAR
jgi:hypothetical protein